MASILINAISIHDLEEVERLLAEGEDPNTPDEEGRRPLHVAIREVDFGGTIDIIKLLIKHGANVNEPTRRVQGASWDVFNDETPILLTCDERTTNPNGTDPSARLSVAEVLLKAGADPNDRRADGESPLRLCAQTGNLEMAKLLLQHGAAETINEYGGGGGLALTALAYAASDLNIPMIELLLKEGADPETLMESDETARDWLPPREEHDPKIWDRAMELLGRSRR